MVSRIKRAFSNFTFGPSQMLVFLFAGFILVGALFLYAKVSNNCSISFIDALFTATSAVCVTGLAVVDTNVDFTLSGQLILLFLIQIGGLGIMTMATMLGLLVRQEISLQQRVFLKEDLNQLTLKDIFSLLKFVFFITLFIEFIGFIILSLNWYFVYNYSIVKALYFSFFHSISAFCNAGFSLFSDSLSGFKGDFVINFVISLLIILGGTGFAVSFEFFERTWFYKRFIKKEEEMPLLPNRSDPAYSIHSKIVLGTTIGLLIAGFIVFLAFESNNPNTLGKLSVKEKIYVSAFQSVTPRTAGFNTIDIDKLSLPTVFIFLILMFIGASPGSTGGGIKTTTFTLLVLAILAMARAEKDVEFSKRRIPQGTIYKAFVIVAISAVSVSFGILFLLLTDGHLGFVKIVFEAISAFGTVGLSMGITSKLSYLGKVIVIILMFIGRLGPLTIAFALGQSAPKPEVRCPEENIVVG